MKKSPVSVKHNKDMHKKKIGSFFSASRVCHLSCFCNSCSAFCTLSLLEALCFGVVRPSVRACVSASPARHSLTGSSSSGILARRGSPF